MTILEHELCKKFYFDRVDIDFNTIVRTTTITAERGGRQVWLPVPEETVGNVLQSTVSIDQIGSELDRQLECAGSPRSATSRLKWRWW